MNMVCALDMSKSSASLHRSSRLMLRINLDLTDPMGRMRKGENAYTTAIRTVAEILQDYDYDKKVLGLTFGANRWEKRQKYKDREITKTKYKDI